MKITHYIFLLVFCFGVSSTINAQEEEFIEEYPKYASKAEKDHVNKRDMTGRRVGTWKIFNRDRIMISEIEYDRDVKNGRCAKYHPVTGKLIEERNYVYGKLDGPYQRFTATGELIIEGEYIDGKKSGVWTFNYPSGTVKCTGSYVNGYKEGKWEYFNRKEELTRTVEFKGGKSPSDLAPPPAAKKEEKKGGKPGPKPAPGAPPSGGTTPSPAPAGNAPAPAAPEKKTP